MKYVIIVRAALDMKNFFKTYQKKSIIWTELISELGMIYVLFGKKEKEPRAGETPYVCDLPVTL